MLHDLTIPRARWMSSNDRLHYQTKARRTAAVREMSRDAAAGLPALQGPHALIVTVTYPTARRADPPNAWPTVKAAVDGLVDAGVLADDDHRHVPITTFQRGAGKSAAGTYGLRFDLVPCDGGLAIEFPGWAAA